MKGSGGTDGGFFLFGIGFLLSITAAWFFLDSVQVATGHGALSGFIRGRQGVGSGRSFGQTTSMGIIFVPFLISVIALFYDATKKWAWWLLYIGIGIVVVEILSHLRFEMSMKTSHLMLIMGMFAAGVGLMLRSYRETGATIEKMTTESLGTNGGGDASAKHQAASQTNAPNVSDTEKHS